MLLRCPHCPQRGTGWLEGWRLTFGGEDIGWEGAMATVVEAPGSRVFVVLYDVPGDDAIQLGSFGGSAVSAWSGHGRFCAVGLVTGDIAWLPGGVLWPGAFWLWPFGEVAARGGVLVLVAAEADLPRVAWPVGELVLDAGDLFGATQAGVGEGDLGCPVQAAGEAGEVAAVQGGSTRRAKPIRSAGW